jgi:phycocyanin beta chain
VAAGIEKLKEESIRIVNDPANITPGDCSSLIAELSTYFDRAAAAVV